MIKVDIQKIEKLISDNAKKHILPSFRNLPPEAIMEKGPGDYVTKADQAMERELTADLLSAFPRSLVFGEEAYAKHGTSLAVFEEDRPLWVIDPIDGTLPFIEGKRDFGVIVALVCKNETLAAWLYDPLSESCVTAEKGAGAFYAGKKLNVLPPADLASMVGIVGHRIWSRFEPSERPTPQWEKMRAACHEYARLTTQGEDGFGMKKPQAHFRINHAGCTPWDDAAGNLIHAEAGGYGAHWNGEPFRPNAMRRGIVNAPSKESWMELRHWVSSFCPMPE